MDTREHKVPRADEGAARAHLDVVHAQDVPTVVHVLLEVFVLDRVGEIRAHDLQQLFPVEASSALQAHE